MPAPSNIILSNSSICEGSPNGTLVAEISIAGISCTHYVVTLINSSGGAFILSGSDVHGYSLLVNNPLLLIINIPMSITLQVVDELGNSLIQTYYIQVVDCSTLAPILTRFSPTASKIGTAPAAVIYGNYLALSGAPILTINNKPVSLISYTNTQMNFALSNLPAGTYTANVTNGNGLSNDIKFYRFTSDVGPNQNIGNLYCISKPTMGLVFDSDGAGGKFGATIIVTPPNINTQYIQVYLKYNYNFNWHTGGEETLDGVKLQNGDLVYLAAQSNPVENGIYIVRTGAWTFYRSVTNNTFIDLGARSYDSIDGNLSRDIITDMAVDFSTPGVYKISYYSMNSMNVVTVIDRQVDVLAQETIDMSGVNGNPPGSVAIVTGSISPTNGFWISDYQIAPSFDSELINELLLNNSFVTPRCPGDINENGDLPIQDNGLYIRKDGLTIFIANQSMGDNQITDGAAGSAPGDSATLQQLANLLEYTPTIITQYTAGEPIAAMQVVYIDSSSKIFIADNNNPACINLTIGIAISNATIDEAILVCCGGSVIGFNGLITSANYWLGRNGSMLSSPPTAGYDLLLGIATKSTDFLLTPQPPLIP